MSTYHYAEYFFNHSIGGSSNNNALTSIIKSASNREIQAASKVSAAKARLHL
jgi:hypothetical protein